VPVGYDRELAPLLPDGTIVWRDGPCVNVCLISTPLSPLQKTVLPWPEGPQVCRWGIPRMGQRLQNAVELLHFCG